MTVVALLLLGVAHAECDGKDWAGCRKNMISQIFNTSGELPDKSTPDYIIKEPEYEMNGFPAPGQGSGVGKVSWKNNLQKLIWTMKSPFLTLNTTVFHTFNTSGNAPANYPPPPNTPGAPTARMPDFDAYTKQGKTLILYHNGHETADCTANYDGVVDYFNELGYDVMELMMPLIGCNQAYQYGNPKSHQWFAQFEAKGDHTMRYFIEPVVLAVNYAVNTLNYENIIMIGLSGGGWTTTIASAVDARIQLSFPIAGSTPKFSTKYFPHWVPDWPEGIGKPEGGGGDYEQQRARPMYNTCDFVCMYILASLEADRHQLQILHEW
jgi:hypothetical protein